MKFKRLMALAMAGVMTFAMAGTAFAEGTPEITKTVNVAEGITLDQEISFTLEQVSNADGILAPNEEEMDLSGSATISFGAEDMENWANGKVVKSGAITLAPAPTVPGEYTYKITEDTDGLTTDEDGFGWTEVNKGNKEFYLHVYVPSTGDPTYVVTNTNTKEELFNEDGTAIAEVKVPAEFENTFTKATTLTLSKAVINDDYVAADTLYTFNVEFSLPTTATVDTFNPEISGLKTGESAVADSDSKLKYTVKLKKDGSIDFTKLPAGTKVTVTEDTTDNINISSTSIVINSNGGEADEITGVTAENVLIGENTNSIAYTNTYTKITPTGLAINIAPFMAMFVAVAAAIVLYVAGKRRTR